MRPPEPRTDLPHGPDLGPVATSPSPWPRWPAVEAGLTALVVLYFLATRLKLVSTTYLPTFELGEMGKGSACLADTGMLGNIFGPDSGVTAHLAPVFPILLASIHKIFGTSTPASYAAQGVVAVLYGAAALLLLRRLAGRTGLLPGVGLAAIALVAVGKNGIWYETRGDCEQNLSIVYLLALLLLAVRLQDTAWSSGRWAAVWGLMLGLGALLNPSISIPAAGLIMLGQLSRPGADRRLLVGRYAIAAAVAGLVLAPWVYRNYRAFGVFVPLRSNLGLELQLGNNPKADGYTYSTNVADHPHDNPEQLRRYKELGEIRYMKSRQAEAIGWIAAHPARFLELTARRAAMFWFSDESVREGWPGGGVVRKLKQSWVGLLALCGLAWMAAVRHRYGWIYFAAMAGPASVYLVTHVYSRYSYPIYGLKLLVGFEFAAWMLIGLVRRFSRAPSPTPT